MPRVRESKLASGSWNCNDERESKRKHSAGKSSQSGGGKSGVFVGYCCQLLSMCRASAFLRKVHGPSQSQDLDHMIQKAAGQSNVDYTRPSKSMRKLSRLERHSIRYPASPTPRHRPDDLRRHHVSTLSRNLHREAAMAEKDDDAAVQLVLQRRRLQEARLEVRTPTCHARSQFDRVN